MLVRQTNLTTLRFSYEFDSPYQLSPAAREPSQPEISNVNETQLVIFHLSFSPFLKQRANIPIYYPS